MMPYALIAFSLSLVGLVLMFVVRYREVKRGEVYFPRVRDFLDEQARILKSRLLSLRHDVAKIVPLVVAVSHVIVHDAALAVAGLARLTEREAHRLADFVSHKRNFKRGETGSEFLKRVSEYRRDENASHASGVEGEERL